VIAPVALVAVCVLVVLADRAHRRVAVRRQARRRIAAFTARVARGEQRIPLIPGRRRPHPTENDRA
jgi:hypothetical protein